jgi:hypothetical protein
VSQSGDADLLELEQVDPPVVRPRRVDQFAEST